MMLNYVYVGNREFLKGHGAIGMFRDGEFVVQTHEPAHNDCPYLERIGRDENWEFGWHETPFEDWRLDP